MQYMLCSGTIENIQEELIAGSIAESNRKNNKEKETDLGEQIHIGERSNSEEEEDEASSEESSSLSLPLELPLPLLLPPPALCFLAPWSKARSHHASPQSVAGAVALLAPTWKVVFFVEVFWGVEKKG